MVTVHLESDKETVTYRRIYYFRISVFAGHVTQIFTFLLYLPIK